MARAKVKVYAMCNIISSRLRYDGQKKVYFQMDHFNGNSMEQTVELKQYVKCLLST